MSHSVVLLRGATWDHPRAVDCLVASSREFERSNPDVRVEWTARSLESFERTPLHELAREFDVLAIDHPLLAEGVESRALAPLDDLVPPESIERHRADSMGRSHVSYRYAGRQWAFAVDAACQVSAYAPDLLEGEPPRSWDDVRSLARSLGRDRIALAANPIHLWCTLLSLCNSAEDRPLADDGVPAWWHPDGIDPAVLLEAVERLRELVALCAPESARMSPIDVLDAMSRSGSRLAYVPLVFGYVTYTRARDARSRPLAFCSAPSDDGAAVGTVTGGVGLAVSARSRAAEQAARLIDHVTSPRCQSTTYAQAGGQPASAHAWRDGSADGLTGGFLSATRETMDRAFLRPRMLGYAALQERAAEVLHSAVNAGEPAARIASHLTTLRENGAPR